MTNETNPTSTPVASEKASTPRESQKENDFDNATIRQDDTFLTTSDGVRVNTTNDTLKAGHRGPSLMQDFHYQEKLSSFDRERIPERVVHARGYGAHGVFEAYEDCSAFTSAHFLGEAGRQTPVFVRFSTVAGFRGSPDTVRDVRGFAVKFYTDEGNFDLVGNDLPVFFIQDAMKFPDFVHAVKPEQDTEMPQAASAHDTFWDFISLQPEATHMVMWAMSDRGIPRSLRTIEGFGVHTFIMTTADGKASFVKFHWKPLQGLRSNVWDEHQKIAGKNPDFHRKDLWDAIEAANFPEWELGLQIVPIEDEFRFDFDLLDPTKLIPEEEVPVRRVGKMTLNRNTANFHAETEQIALHPGRFVPGIGASNDPLLQGRMFSYLDTQMHRLGGANFNQLPINRPVAATQTNQRGGQHQTEIHEGKGSFFPNSTAGGYPTIATPEQGAYVHYPQPVDGVKEAKRAESFLEFYSQAQLFWNSQTDAEKDHLAAAMVFELGKVKNVAIRQRVIESFNNVDHDLATRLGEGLGLPVPANVVANHGRSSRALTIDGAERLSIKAATVAVLVADGFGAACVDAVKTALTAEGATVQIITPTSADVTDDAGAAITGDETLAGAAPQFFDSVVIAGGEGGSALAGMALAKEWADQTYRHFKPILAIGTGAGVLHAAGIAADASAGVLVVEKGAEGADALVKAVYQGRFWNREVDRA